MDTTNNKAHVTTNDRPRHEFEFPAIRVTPFISCDSSEFKSKHQ